MTTVSKPRGRLALGVLWVALVVGACILVAVRWSEVIGGLSLAVAVFAWLTPRSSDRSDER